MKFEEQFPSLKGEVFTQKAIQDNELGYFSNCDFVHVREISESCIDKQRLKEELRILFGKSDKDKMFDQVTVIGVDYEQFLKEVGL